MVACASATLLKLTVAELPIFTVTAGIAWVVRVVVRHGLFRDKVQVTVRAQVRTDPNRSERVKVRRFSRI